MACIVTMPPLPSLPALLPRVVALAREAGRAILEVYRQDFAVITKDDASPLTQADLAAHRLLVPALRALTPGLPIVSEEQAQEPYATRRRWLRHWLVDPLDGTREFVERSDDFTVNVALVHAGRALLGVVHVPVGDVTYAGVVGHGARRQQGDAHAEAIGVRPPVGDELVVLASRSHLEARTRAFLDGLAERHRVTLRQRGSALKICLIAEGSAHLYPRLGPTMEWDTAAAHAVLSAAGGVLCEVGGQAPLRYGKADLRNPSFYAAYGPGAPHP